MSTGKSVKLDRLPGRGADSRQFQVQQIGLSFSELRHAREQHLHAVHAGQNQPVIVENSGHRFVEGSKGLRRADLDEWNFDDFSTKRAKRVGKDAGLVFGPANDDSLPVKRQMFGFLAGGQSVHALNGLLLGATGHCKSWRDKYRPMLSTAAKGYFASSL